MYIHGVIAYDGTDFHGFQYQVDVPTVQGMLEDAVRAFSSIEGRVIGSGRTDAGVHATGQVVGVHAPWRHSIADFQRAWNAHLPASICVLRSDLAPVSFHPRFSALSRTYRYTVLQPDVASRETSPPRSPLTDRYALYVPRLLDVTTMNRAAADLLGEHDFATFGQPPEGVNTVRCITRAEWQWVADESPTSLAFPGRKLVFTVTASAFLRQMVRSLVGSLLAVGTGRWSLEDFQQAFEAKERHRSAPPVLPNGLMLVRIEYPSVMGINEL